MIFKGGIIGGFMKNRTIVKKNKKEKGNKKRKNKKIEEKERI